MQTRRQAMAAVLGIALAATARGQATTLAADAEATALAAWLDGLPREAAPLLRDTLDGATAGRITGPIAYGPGRSAGEAPGDQAALFPEDRSEALFVYYGPFVPRRGRIALDLRIEALPKDHHFMTLFSIGTGGNTCMTARLRLDGRVAVAILTPAETVSLVSEPQPLAAWHRFELTYAPEGALLRLDGVIQDFATDYSTPYACELSNAFYLGDQPWWDPGGRKAVFYALDSFVGRIDNLEVMRLGTELPKGATR
jgi:hypothetical protein